MGDSFDRLHRIGYPPGTFTSPATFNLDKYKDITKNAGPSAPDAFRTGDYSQIIKKGDKNATN